MDCGLKVELQQKLIMTPQLRQALAVLQLSSLDLSLIEKELAENPALELDEIKSALDEQGAAGQAEQQASYAEWADYFRLRNGFRRLVAGRGKTKSGRHLRR